VAPLRGRRKERALTLAQSVVDLVDAHLGSSRGELMTALRAVESVPSERKLARGLAKLTLDRCTFDAADGVEPAALREQVFLEATRRRRAGGAAGFDRAALLADAGAEHDLNAGQVVERLYADLRETWLLQAVEPIAPAALVELYDTAQAQAVLLRAVKVQLDVEARDPEVLRGLFRRLKFHRLLFELERLPPRNEKRPVPRYRLQISGPYSLFTAVSRYGLQLALLVPALEGCDRWWIEAELVWGQRRDRLQYTLEGGKRRGKAGRKPAPWRLPDDVARLVADIERLDLGWRAEPCAEILDLPGVGLCVPDLHLHHEDGGAAYVEVMGYWSRAAVWKRVELVQAGLSTPIVFAASERLRVSEAVLPDDLPGALHIYKGVMHARSVLDKAKAVSDAAKRNTKGP